MSDLVSYQLDTNGENSPIATITLDDGKANVLSPAMLADINAALDKAEAAGAVVILTGRAGRLTGGFDLSIITSGDTETIIKMSKAGAELAERFINAPFPVIIVSTGHCMAMGALLLLSADYRIGTQGNFKIGLNETIIGMVMPAFGCEIARYSLSHLYFRRCLVNAEICNPETAITAGFLDEAVASEQLLSRAMEKAQEFSALNMPAFKGTKLSGRKEAREALRAAIEKDFGK